jgi:peptidase YpeB-like protein
MKRNASARTALMATVLAGSLAIGSVKLVKADQPAADWMPAQQVIETVLKSGYTQVTKLEADDGRWEGEGIKNGQKMEFHADPKTGAITFEKPDR